jgi:hypothetical protein
VTGFQEAVEGLSRATEARLLVLFDQWVAGELDTVLFEAQAVALIGRARLQALGIADLSLAAAVSVREGRAVPALGLRLPGSDPERLAKGLRTLTTAAEEGLRDRVGRLGRSEPAQAAQDGFIDGMRVRRVPGFTRTLNPDACQLCVWLRKEGYVYPADANFHKHTGCLCVPSPAWRYERAY